MRKVKCINNSNRTNGLTIGKIYDVLEFYPNLDGIDDCIFIKNDLGFNITYYMHILKNNGFLITLGELAFIDATHEFRNEVIDEILG